MSVYSGDDDETRWEQVVQAKVDLQVVSINQGAFEYLLYSIHHPDLQFLPGGRDLDDPKHRQEWQVDKADHAIDALWFFFRIRHVYYILRDIGGVYPGIKMLSLFVGCPLNVVSGKSLESMIGSESFEAGTAGRPSGHIHKPRVSIHQTL